METTVCKYDNHCKRANCKYLHPSRGEGKFASIKASKTQFNSNRVQESMAETSHFSTKIQTKSGFGRKKNDRGHEVDVGQEEDEEEEDGEEEEEDGEEEEDEEDE